MCVCVCLGRTTSRQYKRPSRAFAGACICIGFVFNVVLFCSAADTASPSLTHLTNPKELETLMQNSPFFPSQMFISDWVSVCLFVCLSFLQVGYGVLASNFDLLINHSETDPSIGKHNFWGTVREGKLEQLTYSVVRLRDSGAYHCCAAVHVFCSCFLDLSLLLFAGLCTDLAAGFCAVPHPNRAIHRGLSLFSHSRSTNRQASAALSAFILRTRVLAANSNTGPGAATACVQLLLGKRD